MDVLSVECSFIVNIICMAIEIERWLKFVLFVVLAWLVPFKLILIFRMAEQWRDAIEPAVM